VTSSAGKLSSPDLGWRLNGVSHTHIHTQALSTLPTYNGDVGCCRVILADWDPHCCNTATTVMSASREDHMHAVCHGMSCPIPCGPVGVGEDSVAVSVCGH
jgi:hypothetical protein